jgi:hypothetical protein
MKQAYPPQRPPDYPAYTGTCGPDPWDVFVALIPAGEERAMHYVHAAAWRTAQVYGSRSPMWTWQLREVGRLLLEWYAREREETPAHE